MKKRMAWITLILVAVLALSVAAPALADLTAGETGEVISQNVSLRNDHASGAAVIKSLKNGETFTITDRWNDWLHVVYVDAKTGETLTGWLLNYYVVENPMHIVLRNSNTAAYAYPSSDSKRVGSLAKYTRLTVIAQLDRYWIVSLREAAAAIPKSAAVWLEEELANWAVVAPTAGTVSKRTTTRTGPGTNWASVQTLGEGTAVEILATDGDWLVIRYKDAIAYIKAADVAY